MDDRPVFEKYPYRIESLTEEMGGGFVITFPNLPGCMSDGETREETIANGRDAFDEWMANVIAEGQPVPEPKHRGLGTILTEIGQEFSGIELDIKRDSTPSEPISFGEGKES